MSKRSGVEPGPSWERLGTLAPTELVPWRLQLHWAAQIVAAAGHTFAEPRSDDSHTSLSWDSARRWLVGEPLPETTARAALDVPGLSLVVAEGHADVARVPLDGRTLEEGYGELARLLADASGGALRGPLSRRDYDMPHHPVATGARFSGSPPDGYAELARWYGNAAALLERLRRDEPDASVVRCWPHHFDIAVLVSVPRGGDEAGSIGVGMTPGDEWYQRPYWYVTAYPHPDDPALLPLPSGGEWRREGWLGAVLTGDILVAVGGSEAQSSAALRFVSEAVGAARALVAASPR